MRVGTTKKKKKKGDQAFVLQSSTRVTEILSDMQKIKAKLLLA